MASFADGGKGLTAKEEDQSFLDKFVPEAAINTVTPEFINLTIMRTAYSRLTVVMLYPVDYPDVPLTVELSSPTLPVPLLRNKEKECSAAAKEHMKKRLSDGADAGAGAGGQVASVYNLIQDFIQENLFIPCWKEVKQTSSMLEAASNKMGENKISTDEKTGVVNLLLKCKGYFQVVKLTVPELYPEEGVQVEFGNGNFPSEVTPMYLSHCQEIVRRCEAGFSPDTAATALAQMNESALSSETVKGSAVRRAVEDGGKKEIKTRALDAEGIKALKNDERVLQQISVLRTAAKAPAHAFQYEKHAVADRKAARQKLRRLARTETAIDQEEEEFLKEMEQQEMLSLLKSKCSDTAQPSLLPVSKYLCEEFANRLPQEPCQKCQESVLPPRSEVDGKLIVIGAAATTGAADKKKGSSSGGGKKPMRIFCGHWLHYECLDNWLTTPPFVRDCEVCTRRIWHPQWPQDPKQLERAWQMKEAARREQSEIGDLLGF